MEAGCCPTLAFTRFSRIAPVVANARFGHRSTRSVARHFRENGQRKGSTLDFEPDGKLLSRSSSTTGASRWEEESGDPKRQQSYRLDGFALRVGGSRSSLQTGGDSSGIRPRTMTMRRGHSDCREIAPSGGDFRRANFRANPIVTQGLHIIARPVDVWPTARISLLASCLSITAGRSNAGR